MTDDDLPRLGGLPTLFNGSASRDEPDDVHSLLKRIQEIEFRRMPTISRAVVSSCVPLTRTRDGVEELAFCWLIPDPDDLHLEILSPPLLRDPEDVRTRTLRGMTFQTTIRESLRRVVVFHPVVWAILVSACWWGWFRGTDPDRAVLWELALENLETARAERLGFSTSRAVNPLRLQLAMTRLGADEYHRIYVRACLLIADLVQ